MLKTIDTLITLLLTLIAVSIFVVASIFVTGLCIPVCLYAYIGQSYQDRMNNLFRFTIQD